MKAYLPPDPSQYVPSKDTVIIPDSLGNTMNLLPLEKRPHMFVNPTFNKEMIDNLPDYPLRDDDILLCSFPKAGSHWLWEVVRQLVSGKAVTEEVEKNSSMMESNKLPHNIEDLPSPRILNNHQYFDVQPMDILKKRNKVILLYRNPKDLAVSSYHHYMGLTSIFQYTCDFKAFLVRFAEGLLDCNSYFEYLKSWEKGIKENPDLNIFVMSYEDLKGDTNAHVRKLAKFLGKDCDDQFLKCLVKETSFDVMKQVKGHIIKDDKYQVDFMYRKGQVGDWKNYFTIAQNEWFDIVIRTRMAGSNFFKFQYSPRE